MNTYILLQIQCKYFFGYCLFCQQDGRYAENIVLTVLNSVSPVKRQRITIEWDENNICHAFSPAATVEAKLFLPCETERLCAILADALNPDIFTNAGRRQYLDIFSLINSPANIGKINEMLINRWVFADT